MGHVSAGAAVRLGLRRVKCVLWYIFPMLFKGVAFAVLVAALQLSVPVSGQAGGKSGGNRPSQPQAPAASDGEKSPESDKIDCNGFPCDNQQPRFVVNVPNPPPSPWLLRDQISWGAELVLVVFGYVGIMLALSTLKKIERQTRIAEALVQAAADSAQAALLHAQALIDSERPWLVITVEPSLNIKNAFTILATNRGRTPARIIANLERITIAPDEAHLPETPAYEDVAPGAPLVPIILLTGESTSLKSFSRDDAVALPKTEEELRRLDTWENKIFIHGKVTYRDLIAPPDQQIHTTDWCCWYIHGRQKSGLVIAGPPKYNQHT